MAKKTKTGKSRKDKFYKLAKETGYRSRASFKLIQLNRKFEFLQKCQVLVDLCAAPGGWLQVASKFMPVSSQIIGIDLVPIKSIPNVIALQGDITTEKSRLDLKKALQSAKADCFLNDGAPNVGRNWIHDAYSQATLTLSALKLATEFLRKGGWFVTKVFRSRDYTSLLWVFNQLFRRVHATKPQASRHESAEIFVVCRGFKAPDKIDPKFFDPKLVFSDVEAEQKKMTVKQLIMQGKKIFKAPAEGYEDGVTSLYRKLSASEFLHSDNHVELLSNCTEMVFDDPELAGHALTTPELRECAKDVKVLGRQELRLLLAWRKKMLAYMEATQPQEPEAEPKEEEEEDEEEQLEKQIEALKHGETRELKRQQRRVRRERSKLQRKLDLKMALPNDAPLTAYDDEIFSLSRIKSKKQLAEVKVGKEAMDNEHDEEQEEEQAGKKPRAVYDRYEEDSDGEDEEDEEEGGEEDTDDDEDDSDDAADDDDDENPLVVDLSNESRSVRGRRQADLWFEKDVFEGMEDDADEDVEVMEAARAYEKRGGVVLGNVATKRQPEQKKAEKSKNKQKKKAEAASDGENFPPAGGADDNSDSSRLCWESDDDEEEGGSDGEEVAGAETDSGEDSDYDIGEAVRGGGGGGKQTKTTKEKTRQQAEKDGFEIVAAGRPGKRKLDPAGLALGAMMVNSRKSRREIVDNAFNRYTTGPEDHLPDWFAQDEKKHYRKQLPVTKDMVREYKQQLLEINARPIKKLAEAKARKKRRLGKRMEKARKKAESITENLDMSEREKASHIRQLYKKAGVAGKRPETTYVVAKRGMGKRASRPKGVTGPFKVVDPRMRKDDMRKKARAKSDHKKGKRRKK